MFRDLFLFFLFLGSFFFLDRLNLLAVAAEVNKALAGSYRVLRDPAISDHWKEKYLLKNSRRSLFISLKLTFLIVIFLAPVLGVLAVFDLLFPDSGVFSYLMSLRGILLSLLPLMIFLVLKKTGFSGSND